MQGVNSLCSSAARLGNAAATSAWLGAASLSPPFSSSSLLSPHQIAELRATDYLVVDAFLSPRDTAALLDDAISLKHLSREAGVGIARRRRRDAQRRRANILALHPPQVTAAGNVGARLALSRCMLGLRRELDGALPGVPSLTTCTPELGYVYYDTAGFYKRHIDTPLDDRERSRDARREISVLLYLDAAGWSVEDGGALRIHPPAAVDDTGNAEPTDILPAPGTLVLMRSDRVEHEVLPTRRPRHVAVGWLRSSPARMAMSEEESINKVEDGDDDEEEEDESGSSSISLLQTFRRWRRDLLSTATPRPIQPPPAPGLSRGGAVGGPGRRPTAAGAAARRRGLRW